MAILYREPEAADLARLIHDAETCRISVANYVELSMVIESQLGFEWMRQAEAFFRRVGAGDSELSTVFGLALEMDAGLEDTDGIIHAHPTLRETFHEASLQALDEALRIGEWL